MVTNAKIHPQTKAYFYIPRFSVSLAIDPIRDIFDFLLFYTSAFDYCDSFDNHGLMQKKDWFFCAKHITRLPNFFLATTLLSNSGFIKS